MELIPKLKVLYPDTRIIALTGHSCRELERRLRVLGASYYLAKPFQKAELQKVFDYMAGRGSGPVAPSTIDL
jgi:CheY-like chemotaxis protein